MEMVNEITEAQWLALVDLVMEGLQGKDWTSDPLELSYEQVAEKLGYTREADFYMALWHYHEQRQPEPRFWFRGKQVPRRMPDALLFYLRAGG